MMWPEGTLCRTSSFSVLLNSPASIFEQEGRRPTQKCLDQEPRGVKMQIESEPVTQSVGTGRVCQREQIRGNVPEVTNIGQMSSSTWLEVTSTSNPFQPYLNKHQSNHTHTHIHTQCDTPLVMAALYRPSCM